MQFWKEWATHAGAKVQVQLEQPQRARLSELPSTVMQSPHDALHAFFEFRGVQQAQHAQHAQHTARSVDPATAGPLPTLSNAPARSPSLSPLSLSPPSRSLSLSLSLSLNLYFSTVLRMI
jgi:hypothetical protein